KLTIVFRHDTRRIEPHANTGLLSEDGVEFDVIGTTTLSELSKKPMSISRNGQAIGSLELRENEATALSPSFDLKEDEDKRDLLLAGKWIGGVQVGLLLLILVLGHFLQDAKNDENVTQIRVVEMDKPVPPPPVMKQPVVAPQKKVVKQAVQPQPRKVVQQRQPKPQPRIVTKNAPKTPTRNRQATARVPKTAPAIENMGALGALGGVSKKMQSGGGLNLSGASLARGGDRGTGGGGVGNGGAGGISGALFGKGLIAASNGSGARAGSAGGYGTKGKGGGRAGYGTRNMLGASGGYVAPLDSESFVGGGLTREQVEEVILRNMGQITYCYEKGLQVEPSLKGRVAVSFVIGSGGQVNSARVQHSSVASRQLEGCIVGRVKGFKFPRPVAGVNVQVQYPFSFQRVSAN
ncbi:MAG: AgmX/PglI C-terminal domain-containing protein, partial [Bdellovibrionales bacterium]|nr:AgmX/PglI C-terminal domain-containing protein [Bdellovibrionales bacterium]